MCAVSVCRVREVRYILNINWGVKVRGWQGMMTESVTVTVQDGSRPAAGGAPKPEGGQTGFIAGLTLNLPYYRSIPGILKIVQLVSRRLWRVFVGIIWVWLIDMRSSPLWDAYRVFGYIVYTWHSFHCGSESAGVVVPRDNTRLRLKFPSVAYQLWWGGYFDLQGLIRRRLYELFSDTPMYIYSQIFRIRARLAAGYIARDRVHISERENLDSIRRALEIYYFCIHNRSSCGLIFSHKTIMLFCLLRLRSLQFSNGLQFPVCLTIKT